MREARAVNPWILGRVLSAEFIYVTQYAVSNQAATITVCLIAANVPFGLLYHFACSKLSFPETRGGQRTDDLRSFELLSTIFFGTMSLASAIHSELRFRLSDLRHQDPVQAKCAHYRNALMTVTPLKTTGRVVSK